MNSRETVRWRRELGRRVTSVAFTCNCLVFEMPGECFFFFYFLDFRSLPRTIRVCLSPFECGTCEHGCPVCVKSVCCCNSASSAPLCPAVFAQLPLLLLGVGHVRCDTHQGPRACTCAEGNADRQPSVFPFSFGNDRVLACSCRDRDCSHTRAWLRAFKNTMDIFDMLL